jgi:alpha-L-fucosidase 2
MLLQNDGEVIHLLPALPDAWRDGDITGLRTRGGCTVDIQWRDGKLVRARIAARDAVTRAVRLNAARNTVHIPARGQRVLRARDFA